jgi:hypothetical protein
MVATVPLASAACGETAGLSSGPGARLAPGRDATGETVSVTGSLRRITQMYPDIWVVADVKQGYDLTHIAKTSRRERVHYSPVAGKAFEVTEEHEYPAGSRPVDCALEGLPGERIAGTMIEARTRPGSEYAGKVVVDVDNGRANILPGMRLALAVHTDREPVMLMGTAELPEDAVTPPSAAR